MLRLNLVNVDLLVIAVCKSMGHIMAKFLTGCLIGLCFGNGLLACIMDMIIELAP
jgi:hypothetical protein